ncbi:hypothetical protein Q3G72_024264 [Acer saccharum]|nr:hypothetical protein Q3G72_024264 [Acer saccharum]
MKRFMIQSKKGFMLLHQNDQYGQCLSGYGRQIQGKILFSISINFAHPVAFDYEGKGNLEKQKGAKGSQLEASKKAMNIQCKVYMHADMQK